MLEIIFVIVILGILAAVAIPRFAATRDDADISKGRADIAAIRSAIVTERQSRLITGDSSYIANGTATGQMDSGGLFGGVLNYPVANVSGTNGKWSATAGSGTYVFQSGGTTETFTYDDTTGKFDCNHANQLCKDLTE